MRELLNLWPTLSTEYAFRNEASDRTRLTINIFENPHFGLETIYELIFITENLQQKKG